MRPDAESPRELVDEAEGHLRALLRDVLCGYLDADLKGVADDILLEAGSEPFMERPEAHEIEARDLRKEPRFERASRLEPSPAPEPTSRTPTTTRTPIRAEPDEPAPTTRPSSTPSPTPPSSRRSRSRQSPCSTSSTA